MAKKIASAYCMHQNLVVSFAIIKTSAICLYYLAEWRGDRAVDIQG